MAAGDEFPRSYSAHVDANSPTNPTIILPASPGIVHVVTHVKAQVTAGTGAASGGYFGCSINDGSRTLVLGFLQALGTNSLAELEWTGEFAGLKGAAVTIILGNGVAANYGGGLNADFYPL